MKKINSVCIFLRLSKCWEKIIFTITLWKQILYNFLIHKITLLNVSTGKSYSWGQFHSIASVKDKMRRSFLLQRQVLQSRSKTFDICHERAWLNKTMQAWMQRILKSVTLQKKWQRCLKLRIQRSIKLRKDIRLLS